MANTSWNSLDVHLLQVLYALLTESSVSRAARRLNQSQPAVSTALRRLREITGDQLLVRSGNSMTLTDRGASLLEPVKIALQQIESIALQGDEDPAQTRRTFNVAIPDFLNAFFIGHLLARIHKLAPGAQVAVHSLGPDFDYARALQEGQLDMVIGNWPQPPEHLRMAPLFDDSVVALMREGHPLAKKDLTAQQYLEAEHLVPTPYSVGQRGTLDTFLARERLKRNVVAYIPYFSLAPYTIMHTDMIFTAPRMFAEHYASFLPLTVKPAPLDFPQFSYYLLWHNRTHYSQECRWFREQIATVAQQVVEQSREAQRWPFGKWEQENSGRTSQDADFRSVVH